MSKFKLTQTAAEVQGILNNFNSLESDAEGNLTVGKNLGVDGKLTLKSLVSTSNPDGDITKELGGGGQTHGYSVIVNSTFHYEVYTTKDYNLEIGQETTIQQFFVDDNYSELRQNGHYPAAGYYRKSFDGSDIIVNLFEINNGYYYIDGYNMTKSKYEGTSITPGYSSVGVIQLF